MTERPHESQETIAAWADNVFGPHAGPALPLLRAFNELVEAAIAAGLSQDMVQDRISSEWERQAAKGATADQSNLPSEVAGTVIVLYRVAQAAGFDLHDAIDAEMQKNRSRQQFTRGDGTGSHVPAAGEAPGHG